MREWGDVVDWLMMCNVYKDGSSTTNKEKRNGP